MSKCCQPRVCIQQAVSNNGGNGGGGSASNTFSNINTAGVGVLANVLGAAVTFLGIRSDGSLAVALDAGTGCIVISISLATLFANADLSGLPIADPGGGKPWLNGGVMQVGP